MRSQSLIRHCACTTVTLITISAASLAARADSLPPYMQPIAGRTTSTAADTATKNVLALNTGMFELYGDAARIFQKNILSRHPVILGLFSEEVRDNGMKC